MCELLDRLCGHAYEACRHTRLFADCVQSTRICPSCCCSSCVVTHSCRMLLYGRACRGYLHCLRHMSEGGAVSLLRQLFRGWGINCIKTAPGAAVQFVAYDWLRLVVTSIDPSSGAVSPL